MKFGGKHIAIAIAAVVVTALLYRGYSVLYASPRDAFRSQIRGQTEALAAFDGDAVAEKELERRREAVHATMLGGRVDAVEHQFRTRLHDVAVSCGLVEPDIEVTSGSPSGVSNPAAKGLPKGWKRLFEERMDFGVIRGGVSGVGTLDQVLRTIATLQAQVWAHRVDAISIRPLNGGEVFDLRVGVATLFFPNEEPPGIVENVALQAGVEDRWAGIVVKNAFRKPLPDEPVVARVPTPPVVKPTEQVKPPPPYHEWRMVGVWDGTNAMGVIMAHTSNGRSRLIEPGQRVLGLRLVVATGERAEFEFEGKRYELLQKQTLAERRVIEQPRG